MVTGALPPMEPRRLIYMIAAAAQAEPTGCTPPERPLASKEAAFMTYPIEALHGREILDSRGNPTVEADVVLVSNDGDFVEEVGELLDGRRVGLVGFVEFRNHAFSQLVELAE